MSEAPERLDVACARCGQKYPPDDLVEVNGNLVCGSPCFWSAAREMIQDMIDRTKERTAQIQRARMALMDDFVEVK